MDHSKYDKIVFRGSFIALITISTALTEGVGKESH